MRKLILADEKQVLQKKSNRATIWENSNTIVATDQ